MLIFPIYIKIFLQETRKQSFISKGINNNVFKIMPKAGWSYHKSTMRHCHCITGLPGLHWVEISLIDYFQLGFQKFHGLMWFALMIWNIAWSQNLNGHVNPIYHTNCQIVKILYHRVPRRNLDYFETAHVSAVTSVDPDWGNGELTIKIPNEALPLVQGRFNQGKRHFQTP